MAKFKLIKRMEVIASDDKNLNVKIRETSSKSDT